MKKKGFTLVELLGVITVLGITALLIIPSVEKVIKKNKEKALENNKKTIITATKNWITDNKQKIMDGDEYIITVGDLKTSGYLEFNIKNPVTEKCISNETEILIVNKDNKFDYYFNSGVIDGTKDECEMTVAKASLYLIGKNPMKIKQGDEFVDPGFNAYDEDGKDVARDVVVTNNVDTSKVGTYQVVYTLTIDGIVTEKKRTVKVMDIEAPFISHPGTTIILNDVTTFNVMDNVKAVDNSGEVINVKATTNLTLGINGEYEVVYYAKDSSGNEYSDKRSIIVRSDHNTIYNAIKDNTNTYSSMEAANIYINAVYSSVTIEYPEHLKHYYNNKKIFYNNNANNWVRIKNNIYRIAEFSNNSISLIYKKNCDTVECISNQRISDKKFKLYGINEVQNIYESTKNEIEQIQKNWINNQKLDKYLIEDTVLSVHPVYSMQEYMSLYEDEIESGTVDMDSILSEGLKHYNKLYIKKYKYYIPTSEYANNLNCISTSYPSVDILIDSDDTDWYIVNFDNEMAKKLSPSSYDIGMLVARANDYLSVGFVWAGEFSVTPDMYNTFHTMINVRPDLTVASGTGTESDPYVLIP